jgi:hypothetical protein
MSALGQSTFQPAPSPRKSLRKTIDVLLDRGSRVAEAAATAPELRINLDRDADRHQSEQESYNPPTREQG